MKLTFIDGDVDEKTSPYITITGTISHFNPTDHTFQMSPSQYTALTHSATPFPIHGYFVESKRWGEGKKPKLFLGSAITFGVIIDKIHRDHDIDRPIS